MQFLQLLQNADYISGFFELADLITYLQICPPFSRHFAGRLAQWLVHVHVCRVLLVANAFESSACHWDNFKLQKIVKFPKTLQIRDEN